MGTSQGTCGRGPSRVVKEEEEEYDGHEYAKWMYHARQGGDLDYIR
jgi:hypothetical protein